MELDRRHPDSQPRDNCGEIITLLLAAASERDSTAQSHAERVTAYALSIGESLGLSEDYLLDLKHAASLHDIGKIAISRSILNKLGRLTDEEILVMRRHSQIATRILEKAEGLRGALPIIRHHHERYDGGGYPDGLKAEEIPLGARIIAVAETYDILTSDVPWRDALSPEAARRELERSAGSQLDPEIVRVFLSTLEEGFETSGTSYEPPQAKAA